MNFGSITSILVLTVCRSSIDHGGHAAAKQLEQFSLTEPATLDDQQCAPQDSVDAPPDTWIGACISHLLEEYMEAPQLQGQLEQFSLTGPATLGDQQRAPPHNFGVAQTPGVELAFHICLSSRESSTSKMRSAEKDSETCGDWRRPGLPIQQERRLS